MNVLTHVLRVLLLSSLLTVTGLAQTQSTELPSLVAPRLVWPSSQIQVCWENAGMTNSTEAKWVRDAIATTWERHSPLRFAGWGDCAPGTKGIRIRVDDSNPRSYVGTQVDGRQNGMHLNFTFTSWSPDCANPAHREQCIKSIAVHEFGHAIGIFHEQDRPDTPKDCRDQHVTDARALQFAREYGYVVGAYDNQSVMNYCAISGPGSGMTLSPGDIAGVASLYGSRSAFLFCAVMGDRNHECCSHLTPAERSKAAICTKGKHVPSEERLSYFRFCNAAKGPRCCDHLDGPLAVEHAPQQCPDARPK